MPRTKHVLRDAQAVAHRWAHPLAVDDHANNGRNGNVSFQGDTFDSYNTPVAKRYTAPDGRVAYLVSANAYTQTTARHVSDVWGAIPVDVRMPRADRDFTNLRAFRVRYVDGSGRGYSESLDVPKGVAWWEPKGLRAMHKANVAAMVDDAGKFRKKATRARSGKASWLELATDTLAIARQYAAIFRVRYNIPATGEEAQAEYEAALIVSARHRAREEKRRAKDRAEKEAVWEAQREERRRRDAVQIARWQAGENVGFPRWDDTFLRVVKLNDCSVIVETSRSAQLDYSEAYALWRAIKAGTVDALPPTRYGRARIKGDTLVVACHVIALAECDRIANLEKWSAK